MASGLGRMAVPFRSAYVITKYGVEGFSDCLRYEMRPFGVGVSVVEPGNFVAGDSIQHQGYLLLEL
jgi:3-hydroxybutyrate dehydrogenase